MFIAKLIFCLIIGLGGAIMFIAILHSKKIIHIMEGHFLQKSWYRLRRWMLILLAGYILSLIGMFFENNFFWVFVAYIPVFSFVIYMFVKNGYITKKELIKNMEEAESASKFKSEFLANMSHELRTPLNAIIGYSEMLEEDAAEVGNQGFASDAHKIYTAGQHLLAMINDILDLSKIEIGRMELFLEDFSIHDLCREVIDTIDPLMKKNGNNLIFQCEDEIGLLHSDLTKVRQCLFNLLSNASKFTQNGTITLIVKHTVLNEEPAIAFDVMDTGIGMNEEQKSKLFEAFRQADPSISRKYGGTGLGLAITLHFCKMLGGTIEVQSEPDKGTTFTVCFPVICKEEESEKLISPSNKAGKQQPLKENSILVIDDEEETRDLLRRWIEKEGYSVILADSGKEGLRLAKKCHPQLITLDIIMPEMDGWAVLSGLKNIKETRDIPVMIISISSEKNMGYSLGAAEFMTKPIDRNKFYDFLKKYANKHQVGSKVLIVEDDENTLQLMKQMVMKGNYEAILASNGLVALGKMKSAQPDLIFLDLMMPDMDGFEFLERIRKEKKWRDIPVIVVTAKELTSEERARLNHSVANIIQKGSYNKEQLLLVLQSKLTSTVKMK